MTQKNVRDISTPIIVALVLGVGPALLPTSSASAQDAPGSVAAASPVSLVEDAGRAAYLYSKENPGIAVAIRLGTDPSTPTPGRIREVLTSDFQKAGLDGPVTFFFDQNDQPGTGAAFYYSGYVDGPFLLGPSRDAVPDTAETYNFRKSRGLLASPSHEQ